MIMQALNWLSRNLLLALCILTGTLIFLILLVAVILPLSRRRLIAWQIEYDESYERWIDP